MHAIALSNFDSDPFLRQLVEGLPQLIWAANAEGATTYLSQRWLDYTGATLSSHLGSGWLTALHPDDRSPIATHWHRSLATGGLYKVEYRLRRHDGVYHRFNVQASPIRDASGAIQLWVGASTDVEEQHVLRGSLAASESRYRTLAEQTSDIFLLYDVTGRLLDVNERACETFGYPRDALLASPLENLLDPDRESGTAVRDWRELAPGETRTIRQFLRRQDGGRFPVVARLGGYVDDRGHLVFALVSDVTAQHLAETAREEAEYLLMHALEQGGAGTWSWDIRRDEITWDPILVGLLGREVQGTLEDSMLVVHPDDRAIVRDALRAAALGRDPEFDFRAERHGHPLWLSARGRAERAPSGEVIRVTGVCVDISARRTAEIALARSREELRNYVHHLDTAIEQERAHIARELHDELGQRLTALKMDTRWLAAQVAGAAYDREACRARLATMSALIDDTIREVRALGVALRPLELEMLGLAAAIEAHAERFLAHHDIEIDLQLAPNRQVLPDQKLAVFRVYQEALTNVVRHSGARRVRVALYSNVDSVRLEIEDDGTGIGSVDPARRTLGLTGMEERARLLGGTLTVQSAPGAGTLVTLILPNSGAPP